MTSQVTLSFAMILNVACAWGSVSLAEKVLPENGWGSDIVPGVEVGYDVCGERKADDKCLREHGFADAAIAFSFAMDKNYSGSTSAVSFQELGVIDLAESEFIGASAQNISVLMNGALGFLPVQMSDNIRETFSDIESQALYRSYPDASIWREVVSSHRLLADGTQRFTISEMVTEGCRACQPIGTAISFLDIGPSTGEKLSRRAVGIGFDPLLPGMDMEVTPQVLREAPAILQLYLNKLGYDAGSMDGYPGPQTRQALMEFQVEHCLPAMGQLDDKTLDAIISADGFAAPCESARLPAGISANTPLLSGTYVDGPEKCQLEHLSDPDNAVSLWIIDGLKYQTAGYDSSCTIGRTDMLKGLTKFSADCSVEGSSSEKSQWFADLKAVDRFTVWNGDPIGKGQSFARCADYTPLAKANDVSKHSAEQPLLGETADLFNIFDHLLFSSCGEACEFSGVKGQYKATRVTLSSLSADEILSTCEMSYRQGTNYCYPPPDFSYEMRTEDLSSASVYHVERTDCVATGCASAIVAINSASLSKAPNVPGFSGPGGLFVDMRPSFQPSSAVVALPVTQGIYLATSDGDMSPCSYGMDADSSLEVKPSILNFYESSCQITQTTPGEPAGDQMLTLRCTGEGQEWVDQKRFHPVSGTAFEIDTNHYQLCSGADQKQENIEAAPVNSADDFPIPNGDYAVVAELCPPGIPDPISKYGNAAWEMAVSIDYPNMAWFEEPCEIRSYHQEESELVLDLSCSIEGRSISRTHRVMLADGSGFESGGQMFQSCVGNSAEAPLPASIQKGLAFPLAPTIAVHINANFEAYGPGPVSDPSTYISGQLHVGVDLKADAGSKVFAPTVGEIVYYHRLRNSPREERIVDTFFVLRGDDGNDWIFAHAHCTVCERTKLIGDDGTWPLSLRVPVVQGQEIGQVADLTAEAKAKGYPAGVATHLHVGAISRKIVDNTGMLLPQYRGGNWGRLRYNPSDDADPKQARATLKTLGYIDPMVILIK